MKRPEANITQPSEGSAFLWVLSVMFNPWYSERIHCNDSYAVPFLGFEAFHCYWDWEGVITSTEVVDLSSMWLHCIVSLVLVLICMVVAFKYLLPIFFLPHFLSVFAYFSSLFCFSTFTVLKVNS